MAQPCVFVGMGGTGTTLITNLYGRLSQSRSQKALIGERYFFVIFDTVPRPPTIPAQIDYFQLYGDPSIDLDAVKRRIGGFRDFFPADPYVPQKPEFPGAGQEPNFTFFAFCNFVINNPQALPDFAQKIANRLIKLNPDSDFAKRESEAYLPIVYMGGICGGTGSGLSLHLPYLIRALIGARMGKRNVKASNFGVFNSAEATSLFKPLTESMITNAYATAWTLDNWQAVVFGQKESPQWIYRMDYGFNTAEGGVANVESSERPFVIIYWVGNRVDGGQELSPGQVSDVTTDFLYSAFCGTNTGYRYQEHMSNVVTQACLAPVIDPSTGAARAQSYGGFCIARLQFPRQSILKYCGDFVAARWRHLFVDVHHDDLDADMASVVATIARKHNLAESTIHRIWQDRSDGLSIELSRPKDKRRDMLKCASSHALGTHIASSTEELERSYQEAIAQMKRDLRAETTADDLVAKLAEDLLGCLKGQEERYRKVIAGRQISFFYASSKAFDNYLGSLVGEAHDGVMTGLHGRAAELQVKLDSEVRTLTEMGSANKRKGLFRNPIKDDAEKAWSALERLSRLYTDLFAARGAIQALTLVRTRLRVVLTDSISVFKNLMNRHFVAKHENVENMPLPPLQAADSAQSAIIVPVLYDRELIRARWLTGWQEPLGTRPENDPDHTVQERLLSLGEKLVSFGGSKGAGPLSDAMESILKKAVHRSDATPDELAQGAAEKFMTARSLLEGEVASAVKTMDVWQAFWEEAVMRANRKALNASKKAINPSVMIEDTAQGAINEAHQMLRSFRQKIGPIWTATRQLGALQGSRIHEDVQTLFVGPDLKSLGKDHPLQSVIESELTSAQGAKYYFAGAAEKGQESFHMTAWSSYLLVMQTVHGYPLSHLFGFESAVVNNRKFKSVYEAHEASVPGSKRGRYAHTDYKYRHLYKPLDFCGSDMQEEDRGLVVLCEYIADAKPDYFSDGVPRIERKGAANYEVVTKRDTTKIKGRENLYDLFMKRGDLRDEIQGAIAGWMEHVGSKTQRNALLAAVLKWANKRAQSAQGDLKTDFQRDAEVIEALVKKLSA